MTNANTSSVAKLSVAFVAVAMMLSMVAPAKAATIEELQAMIAQLTAQLASLSGSTTTSTAAYTFTRSLTVGAQGADVTALQNFLIAKGHTIAAGATGYFGAQTAAAVAAWQAANGVTPAVGYFGPVSQAKYNASVATTVTTPGSTTTTGLTGGAAEISITNESSDLETEVAAGTTENVNGFRVQATGGDVKVTNLSFTATTTIVTTGASNRINRYAESFMIYVNGDKVATIDADDLTRDSAGVYTGNIALSNVIVKKGEANRATFYVAMKSPSLIDSADADGKGTVSVNVTSIRYTDSTGAILTKAGDSSTVNSGITVAKTASDEKLKIALASDSPKAGTVMINETSTTEVELLKFTLKAEGTDMTFDQVTATLAASVSTSATDLYLYRGTTKIADLTTTVTGTKTFNTYSTQTISAGDTVTYSIKAKVVRGDTGSVNGSTISATLGTVSVENKNGTTVSSTSGSATGETLTMMYKGVKASDFSWSSVATTNTSGVTTKQTFTISFKVSAFGDTMYVPKGVGSAVTNGATFTTGATTLNASALTSNANTVGSHFEIPDGETRTFTATVDMASTSPSDVAGFYKVVLSAVRATTTSTGATASTDAVTPAPSQDFETAERKID